MVSSTYLISHDDSLFLSRHFPFQIFNPLACPRFCLFTLFMFCMTHFWLISLATFTLSIFWIDNHIYLLKWLSNCFNDNCSNRSQSIKFCTSPSDAQSKIGLKPCIMWKSRSNRDFTREFFIVCFPLMRETRVVHRSTVHFCLHSKSYFSL